MKPYEDPNNPGNGPKYHTGKLCIEGCGRPAGTLWSPHWCQPCNAARMTRVSQGFKLIADQLTRPCSVSEWTEAADGQAQDRDEERGR
jgi:hypothetical protein